MRNLAAAHLLKFLALWLFLSLLLIAAFGAFAAEARAGLFASNGIRELSFPTDRPRNKPKLYLPDNFEKLNAMPLLVFLHPFGGDEADTSLQYLHLRKLLAARGVLVLGPRGSRDKEGRGFWNADEACCDLLHSGVDDSGYLLRLIEHVRDNFKVDASRIYLIGLSNGGFMANRLACDRPGLFAAFATVAGGTAKRPEACRQLAPLPFLQIHAEDDPVVPFRDTESPLGSAETALRARLRASSCGDSAPVKRSLDLTSSIPGEDAVEERWDRCTAGAEVRRVSLKAYSGPGHNPHGAAFKVGTGELIADFLLAQRKR